MKQFTFSGKVQSLNIENDKEYCTVIFNETSFILHEGSLEEINKAILFNKHYKITLEELKKI